MNFHNDYQLVNKLIARYPAIKYPKNIEYSENGFILNMTIDRKIYRDNEIIIAYASGASCYQELADYFGLHLNYERKDSQAGKTDLTNSF